MENQDNQENVAMALHEELQEQQQEQTQENNQPQPQTYCTRKEPKAEKFKHDEVFVRASNNLTIIYAILLILLAIGAVVYIIEAFAQSNGTYIIGCVICVAVFIVLMAINQLVKILKGIALDVKYIRNKLYDEQTENLDKIRDTESAVSQPADTNRNQ